MSRPKNHFVTNSGGENLCVKETLALYTATE